MPHTYTRLEPQADSDLATTALRFARRAHLGQHRKQTNEQFVEHPIAVARMILEAGFDDRIVAAAYLHDVLEKSEVEPGEIRERFGPEVGGVVEALSDDDSIAGYADRKRALRRQVLESGSDPVLIYAADRVANIRDWLRVSPEARGEIGERLGTTLEERLSLWDEDLEELAAHDPELPFLGEIELELRTLREELA
jgi:(p)ppGpp synthase/HD superfamily hydrolase